MINTVKRKLGPWIPHISARDSIRRAFMQRRKLPPGRILNLTNAVRRNRKVLIDEAARHGPIFKVFWGRRLCVCVVGLPTCRRFLKENEDRISVATVDLRSLFRHGFMRAMEGETHRRYRDAVVRVSDASVVDVNRDRVGVAVESGLRGYAAADLGSPASPAAMTHMLSSIGRAVLIQIFFGAEAGSATFRRLDASYALMGPDLFVWHPGEAQEQAFREIVAILGGHEPEFDCILGRILRNGMELDETLLGNLIYMVEIGRFDLYSLFRWMLKFAADHPADLRRAGDDGEFAGAFVAETLRLEQAERLVRNVNRDILFDGYFVPAGSKVRLCTWESHKLPDVFFDPFSFDPERFLGRSYTTDQYAPFGLGSHHCPMSAVTVALSKIFLQSLAGLYTVEGQGDGPAQRNGFHWTPARTFWVRLQKRRDIPPPGWEASDVPEGIGR